MARLKVVSPARVGYTEEDFVPTLPGFVLKPQSKKRNSSANLADAAGEGFSPLQKVTLARRVTDMIRNAIVSGVLKPGEFISPQEIGDRLGVSRTPVREALIHLNGVGLVEFLPNRVRIASPTPAAIADAFELREALEGMAARLAAMRRTDKEAREIVKLAEKTQQTYKDRKSFHEDDRNFHLAIGESSGSVSVSRYLSFALDLAFTLRNLRVAERPLRLSSASQHMMIADAILKKDADLAERLGREHVRSVCATVLSETESTLDDDVAERS